MAEYIEREEYCEKHCRCSNEYCDKESCPIWKAPAADVAPVRHGRWKLVGADRRGRGGIWKCTGRDGCGKFYPYKCDFCPNCGAKMDGVEEREE